MLTLVIKFVARSFVTATLLACLLLALFWSMPPARRPQLDTLLPISPTGQISYMLRRAEWTVRHAFVVVDGVVARVYTDQSRVWRAR